MEDDDENTIQEFSKLWHTIMKGLKCSGISKRFQRLSNLSPIEIGILRIVSDNPSVILGEICTDLDVPKSTLTNVVNRLEKKGLVNRIISRRDRRSYGLQITEEGKLVRKEHMKFEEITYGKLLDTLDTDSEKEEMFKLLRKMVENLEKRKAETKLKS